MSKHETKPRDAGANIYHLYGRVHEIFDRGDQRMLAVWRKRRTIGMSEAHRRIRTIAGETITTLRKLGWRSAYTLTKKSGTATPPPDAFD